VKMTTNLKPFKISVLLIWMILFAAILGAKLYSPGIYRYFIREDSFGEYLQSLNYLVASVFSLLISFQFFRNELKLHAVLYAILCVGFFVISAEEISWGQRILNFSNPEYFSQHNVQTELTFHNLDTVQPYLRHLYIAVSAYGAFAWIFSKLLLTRAKSKCEHLGNYVVAQWYLAPYFFVCFAIYTYLHHVRLYLYNNNILPNMGDDFWLFIHWRDEEHGELFLSFGFLFFVVVSFINLRRCEKSRGQTQMP